MGIKVTQRGDFSKTKTALDRMQRRVYLRNLEKYGAQGVAALKNATPKDDGDTAGGWYYEIVDKPGYFAIHWLNSNVVQPGNIPLAVLIQYGHATRTGGYVEGVDYINPTLKPIFDQIAADAWREVTK
jgi:hypothetical protein